MRQLLLEFLEVLDGIRVSRMTEGDRLRALHLGKVR